MDLTRRLDLLEKTAAAGWKQVVTQMSDLALAHAIGNAEVIALVEKEKRAGGKLDADDSRRLHELLVAITNGDGDTGT